MLYFWCPDTHRARGGVKQIYAHVRALRALGVQAFVLHTELGFRCDWFDKQAPCAYLGEGSGRKLRKLAGRVARRFDPSPDVAIRPGRAVYLQAGPGMVRSTFLPDDVLVLPGYMGCRLRATDVGLPTIVFNQGPFETFVGAAADPTALIYDSPLLRGVVCVSAHSQRYLQAAFPQVTVKRVVNGVDPRVFHPDQRARTRQIAYMPSKMPKDTVQVLQMLKRRGRVRGYSFKAIQNMPEYQVARTLRESSIFLNLVLQEGFGLPPVEAGLSGCLVAGYTGFGGEEFFLPELTWPVPTADVLGAVHAVEAAVAACETRPGWVRERRQAFRQHLLQRYSLDHERRSIAEAYRALCPELLPVRPSSGVSPLSARLPVVARQSAAGSSATARVPRGLGHRFTAGDGVKVVNSSSGRR